MGRFMGVLALAFCCLAGPACAQNVPPANAVAIGPFLPTRSSHPVVVQDGRGTTLDYTAMMTPRTPGSVSQFERVPLDFDPAWQLQSVSDMGWKRASMWEDLPSGVYSQRVTNVVSLPSSL